MLLEFAVLLVLLVVLAGLLGLRRSLTWLLVVLLGLLALLGALLLRCLIIRIGFAWALGVGSRGLIVGDLGAMCRLLALLGLLAGLLATALLGCPLCACVVDGDPVVLI
ncbi:hypothetical protein BKG68_20390 [Mycobacteroides saopaulense]|uniref:Uncharacterized protein n=1 Tax=Mycobacteroides saopaulense TaxID=1578165 RepID=A0ABX3BS98_9MYCO|nr:hypothetical protein BKG68_20390 [Mycobacteroides saopaulense]OHU01910.1 hypothetical protein BKG73_24030 [Mycobacteroides saopaulense]